jgi:hypothetical protein
MSEAQTDAAERALWTLWQTHLRSPDGNSSVAAACARFADDDPRSPFLPVAAGLGAWHHLRSGNTNEAVKLLQAMDAPQRPPADTAGTPRAADVGALREAGVHMARTWLARLAREQVCVALRRYYVKHVEYPAALDRLHALPAGQRPPLVDPWGAPWVYRTAGFSKLPRTEGQRYTLRSSNVAGDSRLSDTLNLNYASRMDVRPLRLLSNAGERAVVEFAVGDRGGRQKIALAPGGTAGGLRFGFAGATLLILADADHWLVLPWPTAKAPPAAR